MGGLLLCRNTERKHPYYVKDLGINLYSAEELCYYIYNHAFFLDESFLSESLYAFLTVECRLPNLEKKLRSWAAEGADLASLLLVILQDIHYYSELELLSFKDTMLRIRRAAPAERIKWKADYMLRSRKLESALRLYESALAAEEEKPDLHLRGEIFYNQGVVYAQLFAFREAVASLEAAWRLLKKEEILYRIYALYQLDHSLPLKEELMELIPAEQQYRWTEELDTRKKHASYSGKALEARDILEKNSVRRNAELELLLVRWKQEYRELMR